MQTVFKIQAPKGHGSSRTPWTLKKYEVFVEDGMTVNMIRDKTEFPDINAAMAYCLSQHKHQPIEYVARDGGMMLETDADWVMLRLRVSKP